MIVNRTFHHSLLFPQGYSKSGMIEQGLYLILSLDVSMGQAPYTHLSYPLMCSVRWEHTIARI